MRAGLTPEDVRAAGIYLNGGRRRGWKKRLAALLNTPEATIAAWATRSAGNARPLPGVAAVAIRLLVALLRQEFMTTAVPARAADALTERLAALGRQPELFPTGPEVPLALGQPEPPPLSPMSPVLVSAANAAAPTSDIIAVRQPAPGRPVEDEGLTVPEAYLLQARPRRGGRRKPQ